MPSTSSFVEQIHIGIPREATMDAHLELLTPWKALSHIMEQTLLHTIMLV